MSTKIVFLGDPKVGKTSLINYLSDTKLRAIYIPSLGLVFNTNKATLSDSDITNKNWHAIDNQIYTSKVSPMLYIIVFDVTNKSTFNTIIEWYQFAKKNNSNNMPIYLVGNKIDLTDQRKVSRDSAQKLADDLKMEYHEVSALTKEGFRTLFGTGIYYLLDKKLNRNKKDILKSTEIKTYYKINFIGDARVGKTSILRKHFHNLFREDERSTVGLEFFTKKVRINDRDIRLKIWDFSGIMQYRDISKAYMSNTAVVVIVYDITDKQSFHSVLDWKNYVKENSNQDEPLIIVCGCKRDLKRKRQVRKDEAQKFCIEHGMPYYEVSALTGEGFGELFYEGIYKVIGEMDEE